MKNLFTLILLFVSISMNAQNISVTDFRLDEMDLTANQQGTIVLDQNDEKCALIKVKTTQTGFSFDAGSLGVSKTLQKTAEIWVYVPHGVRKLSISHQKYGSLEYALPVTTQKSKTYIMELKAETPLPVNSQKLTITCTPKSAVVMIDGEPVELQDGSAELILKLGSHHYKAVANGYEYEEGTVLLKESSPSKLLVDLTPKEGNKQDEAKSVSENKDLEAGKQFIDELVASLASLYDVKLGETSFDEMREKYNIKKAKRSGDGVTFSIKDRTEFKDCLKRV